jgi:hypothetical protein
MHLFGVATGPHMAHFHARHHDGSIELDWEVRNAGSPRWRVLRSEQGFADGAEAPGSNGQVLVNESEDTHLTDRGLDRHAHYFYTVFSQEEDGSWQRQVEVKVTPRDALSWIHPDAQQVIEADDDLRRQPAARPAPEGGPRQPTFALTGHMFRPTNLEQRDVQEWLRIGSD